MEEYHVPVLLHECIEGLNINPNGSYVDVTFGGGGHSREILSNLDQGHLFGFDQDIDAQKNAFDDPRFTFVRSNFKYIKNFLRYHNSPQVDGILADLGVSSHHLNESQRGFAFRLEGKLDMRMNQRAKQTAADVLNLYEPESLMQIFRQYGEIKNPGKLARKIEARREYEPFDEIDNFLEEINDCAPKHAEHKYFAKVFQALRIEVNDEMGALRNFLEKCTDVIRPGGRLVVITYHSLEDRMVKNFVRSGNIDGKIEKDIYGNFEAPFKAVNRKVIIPSDEENKRNSRARSAKLRIAERI